MMLATYSAAIVSTLLEGILYGFSLLMFGGTIWALAHNRQTRKINWPMIIIACGLLVLSTAHMIIDIIRLEQGLVLFRDTYPTGPVGFFSDVNQWTFFVKNVLYVLQTLIGDAVVIYRCYIVWQSWYVTAFPIILWLGVGVSGLGSVWAESRATTTSTNVFASWTGDWVAIFYASTLATNFASTALLTIRIWKVGCIASKLRTKTSTLWPIMRILLDAGILYSVTLLATLLCFVTQTRGNYVLLDMIMPIISIAFYMVIVRIIATKPRSFGGPFSTTGIVDRSSQPQRTYPLTHMEVHITRLTETHEDDKRNASGTISPQNASPYNPTQCAA